MPLLRFFIFSFFTRASRHYDAFRYRYYACWFHVTMPEIVSHFLLSFFFLRLRYYAFRLIAPAAIFASFDYFLRFSLLRFLLRFEARWWAIFAAIDAFSSLITIFSLRFSWYFLPITLFFFFFRWCRRFSIFLHYCGRLRYFAFDLPLTRYAFADRRFTRASSFAAFDADMLLLLADGGAILLWFMIFRKRRRARYARWYWFRYYYFFLIVISSLDAIFDAAVAATIFRYFPSLIFATAFSFDFYHYAAAAFDDTLSFHDVIIFDDDITTIATLFAAVDADVMDVCYLLRFMSVLAAFSFSPPLCFSFFMIFFFRFDAADRLCLSPCFLLLYVYAFAFLLRCRHFLLRHFLRFDLSLILRASLYFDVARYMMSYFLSSFLLFFFFIEVFALMFHFYFSDAYARRASCALSISCWCAFFDFFLRFQRCRCAPFWCLSLVCLFVEWYYACLIFSYCV